MNVRRADATCQRPAPNRYLGETSGRPEEDDGDKAASPTNPDIPRFLTVGGAPGQAPGITRRPQPPGGTG